jgi:hypothetical protein
MCSFVAATVAQRGGAGPTRVSGYPLGDVGSCRIPSGRRLRNSGTVSYTVYFRDSEEGLRSLSHIAASASEALDWFARLGIPVVAIHAAAAPV